VRQGHARHDFNDYAVGQRHGLPMISILTLDAKINDAPRKNTGLDRFDARKAVVADLEALGILEKTDKHKLKVPRGDRTGVVIEPMLTDQWFVAMSKPGGRQVDHREGTGSRPFRRDQVLPGKLGQHLQPVAEQHPGLVHLPPAVVGPPDSGLVRRHGEVFVAQNEEEARKQADKAGYAGQLTRDEDVLDTWYSSALWPFSTLDWTGDEATDAANQVLQQYLPSSVLVTGFDIIFFWVARMVMMTKHITGKIPFKHVMCTA
jgi:valyl-tRNA synthetase